MKKSNIALLGLALIFFGPILSNYSADFCLAQDNNSGVMKSADWDGPYIFLQNDSIGTVFYDCFGFFESRECEYKDTLIFQGFCADSNEFYSVLAGGYQVEPDSIVGVGKILAVSDIHGRYDFFTHILRKSGVIDDESHWCWGDGHLVINGDIFDRGDNVTEALWLIYKLENEADVQGGKVHLLLGNHELMAMEGDASYLSKKYKTRIFRSSRRKTFV